MYIEGKRTVVVEIPKCASTSLISAVSSCQGISDHGEHFTLRQHKQKNPEAKLGLAIIREPLDRLRSGVEFCMSRKSGAGVHAVRDDLMQSLRNGRPSDLSVVLYPQYSFLVCDLPVRLYLMSKAQLLLEFLDIFDPLPVKNKTKNLVSADMVIDVFGDSFVRQFYAIDFALYNSLCSTKSGFLDVGDSKEYILSLKGGEGYEGCFFL